jgi:hypothetical protein
VGVVAVILRPASTSPAQQTAPALPQGPPSALPAQPRITEDGNLTSSLVWTSNLAGQIGIGGSFSAVLSDGTHTITASVTDSGGLTGSDSVTITVGGGSSGDLTLSVSAYKVRGNKYADLTWSGANSTQVDVYRNGSKVATTANDGAYTDGPLGVGGGSATYQVCEAGSTSTCSNSVSVSW